MIFTRVDMQWDKFLATRKDIHTTQRMDFASASKLTEVEAREAVMNLLQSGRWEVFISENGRKLFFRTRGEIIHTISDGEEWQK